MTPEQSKLFKLFMEIHEICMEHDIVYYLAGGTLIGAMRHKGFIPWDDDLDIMMTRDEFEKFKAVLSENMPENRALDCPEIDRDYPNMFARYAETTSAAIHNNEVLGDGVAGFVVDILVLDPLPDNGESYKQYTEDLMLYSDLVNPFLLYSYRYGCNADRYQEYYSRIQKEGKTKVLSELEKEIFFRYNEEECDYLVLRWGGVTLLFEKDMYGSSRFEEFEGVMCRVPDRTADYLVQHYGDDWMFIPPHLEHESHDAIFSFDVSYKTIQDDYLEFIDVPATRQSLVDRKMHYFETMDFRRYVNYRTAKAKMIGAKMLLEQTIKDSGVDIEEALRCNDFQKLKGVFAEFLSIQLDAQTIGREDYRGIARFNQPLYSDIDDDTLYVLLIYMIHTNRMSKAMRLLDVRNPVKGNRSGKLEQCRTIVSDVRKAPSEYDLDKKEQAYETASEMIRKYPQNENLNMFYCQLLHERKELDRLAEVAEAAAKLFPQNGVFNKYMGDCFAREDMKKAMAQYQKAKKNTTHGMILAELDRILNNESSGAKNE